MRNRYSDLLESMQVSTLNGSAFRQLAMAALARLPGFDWCGIYRLEGDTLVLGEYVGAATDHTHIPVGRGVCGTAVADRANQVVQDVRELDNYLACSTQTRSELVVLIWRGDHILGQIDIDGHEVGRFGPEEERMLQALAEQLANRWD